MLVRRVLLVGLLVVAASVPAAGPPVGAVDRYGDPLPPGAVARLGTVRFGQHLWFGSGSVQIQYSPDGRAVMAAGEGEVRFWDVSTGKPWKTLEYLPNVQSAQWLADGKTLAALRADSARTDEGQGWTLETRRWTADGVGPRQTVRSASHVPGLDLLYLSPDGRFLCTWGLEARPVLWDARTGKLLHHLGRQGDPSGGVAFTPDASRVILGSGREGFQVYDTATGKRTRTLAADFPGTPVEPPMNSAELTASPDGRLLVVSEENSLASWDLASGRRLAFLDGAGGQTCFSADGRLVACATVQGIQLFEPRTLRRVRAFDAAGPRGVIFGLTFSKDGTTLAASERCAVTFWDVTTGKRRDPWPRHLGWIDALAFSADGRRLASADSDGTILVWDTARGRAVHAFLAPDGPIGTLESLLEFSPDGRWLASAGDGPIGGESRVRVYDLVAGRLAVDFPAHYNGVHSLRFSPDGKRLATGGGDDRVRLWDTATGTRLHQLRHVENARPVGFFNQGKTLLVHEEGTKACLVLDAATFAPLGEIRGEATADVTAVVRVDDQRILVLTTSYLSDDDGKLRTKEVATWYRLPRGEKVRTKEVPQDEGGVGTPSLAPGGRTCAWLRDEPNQVELGDLESGMRFATLGGRGSDFNAIAFSADGRLLATGGSDTTILLWDVEKLRAKGLTKP